MTSASSLKMSMLELDATAKPCDLSVIEQYYEKHVVNLNSPTLSSRTVSSTYSVKGSPNFESYGGESSTASNSDVEEHELDSVFARGCFLQQQKDHQLRPSSTSAEEGNVIVVNNADSASNGPRIAIQNSSDIQFGNKTFYNGPVVIKQFLLDDKQNKWISRRSSSEESKIENGVINDGFSSKTLIINNQLIHLRFVSENYSLTFMIIKLRLFLSQSRHFTRHNSHDSYICRGLTIRCVLKLLSFLIYFRHTKYRKWIFVPN